MNLSKIEVDVNSDDCSKSEELSRTTESSAEYQDGSDRGGTEPKKKMKKLRSIKLSRFPRLTSCTRPAKSPSGHCAGALSGYSASSEQSTPMGMSDASPNYTKATSCSDAKKESFQKSARTFVRRPSFKAVKSMARMSSMKFKRPPMRRSSGATDPKKKLKKSRSIKLPTFEISGPSRRGANSQYDRPPAVLSGDADTSPKNLEAMSGSDVSKALSQASPRNFESSFSSSNDQNRKNLRNSKPDSATSGNKSMRVLSRTSTMGPLRVLTKMSSLRSKRTSMKKCIEVPQTPDSSVHNSTCSSTLKESKFPDHTELQPGRSESDKASVMKVCSYTYCSLHGHRHAAMPPLKRFVSIRRRLLKSQKSMKPENWLSPKAKRAGNRNKGIQTSQTVSNGDPAVRGTAHVSRAMSPVVKNVGRDSSVEVYATPRAESEGVGTHGGDGEDSGDFVNLSEIMLGETSYPDLNLKKTHQSSDFLAEEMVVNDAYRKEEEIVECDPRNGDSKSILNYDHHKVDGFSLPELEEPTLRDNLSLKPDDIVSTCEKIPVDGKVQQEVNADTTASLNLDECKFVSESNITNSEANILTSAKANSPTLNGFEESTAINSEFSSASVCESLEESTAASKEKNEDTEPDSGFLQGFPQTGDSKPDFPVDVANKNQMETQKNIRFWRLIYQRMATGIAAESEQVEDDHTLIGTKNYGSSQGFTGTVQNVAPEDHDTDSQTTENRKIDAIKLVQEAFDKILSEIQDHSSDDLSIASDITSDKELLEQNGSEGGELGNSTSSDTTKDSMVKYAEETGLEADNLKADKINTSKEEKAESMVEHKSNQRMPKSWSNLKKIIILKRFVKAMEKVRNFNPQKPRYLPMEPDPEAEKVNLRPQTMEERKNSEEWMLDFALRQVISTLAPAQKRKVALLVQAFETVIPLPEIETSLRFNTGSTHSTPVLACSTVQNSDETGKENNSGILPGKIPHPEMSSNVNLDQVSDSCTTEQQIPATHPQLDETSLERGCIKTVLGVLASETANTDLKEVVAFNLDNVEDNSIVSNDQPGSVDFCLVEPEEPRLCDKPSLEPDDILITSREEFPVQEVSKEVISIFNSEVRDGDSKFNCEEFESSNLIETNNVQLDKPKSLAAASEGEGKPKNRFLQGFRPREQFEPSTIDAAREIQLEKQKHMKLWYLIYKHMVSGSTEKVGIQQLHEGAEKEEQGDDSNTLLGIDNSKPRQRFSDTDQDIHMENHHSGGQKFELHHHQIEAIKLVEEAIDEIPLPEIQEDTPDERSITGEKIPDQELLEKKHGEGGEFFFSTSTDSAKASFGESNTKELRTRLESKESWPSSDTINTQEEAKTVSKEGNKSKLQTQKSWSNLKKLILLKRFIKSLEKVRKFNPREPQYLPLDPDPEGEKVHLRHQNMGDRKNAEEWMLDYALQQVVARLTPARKRKVKLLVEAFETVVPTIGS